MMCRVRRPGEVLKYTNRIPYQKSAKQLNGSLSTNAIHSDL